MSDALAASDSQVALGVHEEGEADLGDDEHQVTPLELFFDLTQVFAMTQVTVMLADDPTWGGIVRGVLIVAAIWWAWTLYAWLTSTVDVDDGGVRLALLGAVAAMFGVALAVPGAFGDDALVFGVAYLCVRFFHFVLSAILARGDPVRRAVLLRFADGFSQRVPHPRRQLSRRESAPGSVGGRARDRLPRANGRRNGAGGGGLRPSIFRYLRGELHGSILDMAYTDAATLYEAPDPTWVAAPLVEWRTG